MANDDKVTATIDDDGKIRQLTGNPEVIKQMLSDLRQPNPLLDAGAPAPTEADPPPIGPEPPSAAKKGKPFFGVFYDEQGTAVHTTPARRLWSEARDDVKKWCGKNSKKAATATIFEGRSPAPHRGAHLRRARTAWHIEA